MNEGQPVNGSYVDGFRQKIESAINSHGIENGSQTPDFILAQYLMDCLMAWDKATMHREAFYGRAESVEPGGPLIMKQPCYHMDSDHRLES